jgi:hypothetical protein
MQEYVAWYTVSQIVFLILVFVRPGLFLTIPATELSVGEVHLIRKDFTTLVTSSFFPIYREISIVSGFFYWLSTKRFPST